MHETPEDLVELQHLLDRSYESAGEHLLSIHTPERRLTAAQVSERLQGMVLLALATTSADGRPLVGPVDGIFYRGAFWWGTSPTSLRALHVARRPAVSATHIPGEHLSVTVHGRVGAPLLASEVEDGYAQTCVDIYGEAWREWGTDAAYWRIAADRMFTFHMDLTESHEASAT